MSSELAAALVQELGVTHDAAAAAASAVASTWPLTWIDARAVARYFGERLEANVPRDRALADLTVDDLYLAGACVLGSAAAIGALDATYRADLQAAIRTIDPDPDFGLEILAALREKVLVLAPGHREIRLAAYSGHGALGGWLRVTAIRLALSAKRKKRPQVADRDEIEAMLDASPDPGVRVIAHQLGTELRAALVSAFAGQPPRIRAALRMYYADGEGVEAIGAVYGVHASTVSRWLARAREDILAAVRDELHVRLGMPESQLTSALGHVASLEISLDSLLREPRAS